MTFTRDIQLGPCMVLVETNCPEVHRRLAYLDHDAVQCQPVKRTMTLAAWAVDGHYLLCRDGAELAPAGDAAEVLDRLYGIAYRQAFDSLPADAVRLHGVSVSRNAVRALLVGPQKVGKSTLAARLLCEGFDVTGDEYAVLTGAGVCAFPRRFHLKPGCMSLLPELAEVVDGLPFVETHLGRVVALSPTDLGRSWVLAPATVDVLIALEPNHDGTTRFTELSQVEQARALMSQTYTPIHGDGSWIGRICDLASSATCGRLEIGELDVAVVALEALLR